MKTVQLREFCHARSGDKGDKSNIGLIVYKDKNYPLIEKEVTAEKVKEHISHYIKGEVIRYEMPNVKALNFVCYEALDGGAASSLRVDNLGKCMGAYLLKMEIEVPDDMDIY